MKQILRYLLPYPHAESDLKPEKLLKKMKSNSKPHRESVTNANTSPDLWTTPREAASRITFRLCRRRLLSLVCCAMKKCKSALVRTPSFPRSCRRLAARTEEATKKRRSGTRPTSGGHSRKNEDQTSWTHSKKRRTTT